MLQLVFLLCIFVVGTCCAELHDLEITVKDSGPVILNEDSEIQIGLKYSGVEPPDFDIVVTFFPEETKNPVVKIPKDALFFSSSEIENSATKNLTVNGILLGYTNVQVRKQQCEYLITLHHVSFTFRLWQQFCHKAAETVWKLL